MQNNGTQKCTQKQTCIIPNRINTHKTQQSTMYNNSPVTEPNTNNWDTLNAKIDGQRVVYGPVSYTHLDVYKRQR